MDLASEIQISSSTVGFSYLLFALRTDDIVLGEQTRDHPTDVASLLLANVESFTTRTTASMADEQWFQMLVSGWRKERGATSSITKMAACPSYQGIIAIGRTAIPLILRQLESEGDEPDMWFWALKALTCNDPVPQEDQGDFIAMAKAWLSWGRRVYVW